MESPRYPSQPRSPSHQSGKSAFTVLFAAMKSPAVWAVPMSLCALLLAATSLYSQKPCIAETSKGLYSSVHLQIPGRGRQAELLLPSAAVRSGDESEARGTDSAPEAKPESSESEVRGTDTVPEAEPERGSEAQAPVPEAKPESSESEARGTGAEAQGPVPEADKETGDTVPADCDLFHGEWVRDESYPLYTNFTCKIISDKQNCQGNGRPDNGYEKWRWRPQGCEIPRFDAGGFLRAMRGKKILFVGDSLARNQLESLVCLLDQAEEHRFRGSRKKLDYIFQKADVTVSRIWSSWLVDEGVGSVPSVDKENVTLLHLDRIGTAWLQDALQADVVVISSGHWFGKPMVYMKDGKPVGVQTLRNNDSSLSLGTLEAYQQVIRTVLEQLRDNPKFKGVLLLRTYTPDHYEGGQWNTGGWCSGQEEPKPKGYVWPNEYGKSMHKHQVDEFAHAFAAMSPKEAKRFVFMDILPMASTRVDGHPGLYSGKQSRESIAKMIKDAKSPVKQDCLHWCLPGPIDSWNDLILPLVRRALA